MSTRSDLDPPDAPVLDYTATGDPAPRRGGAAQTIIAPFDDASDHGPEPIRVARLDPDPDAQPLVPRPVLAPAPRGGTLAPRSSLRTMLAEVPRWAWIAAALVIFVCGSAAISLVGIAIGLYLYFG